MLAANSKISKPVYRLSRSLVVVAVGRGSQVASAPRNWSPWYSHGGQTGLSVGLAQPWNGNALQRNFYFHFGNVTRDFPGGSVSVRRDLWSACFPWNPAGLHICRALAGRGAAGRLLQGLQTEPGWEGRLLGISPQTPGNGPPAHQSLGQPCLTGQARSSWGGQTL